MTNIEKILVLKYTILIATKMIRGINVTKYARSLRKVVKLY